jgi:hypothetical protein
VLLTRSRLCPGASPGSSLHLHVLSTPPAFVLSQDQTLREELLSESCRASHEGPAVHRGRTGCIDEVEERAMPTLRIWFRCRPARERAVGIDEPGRTSIRFRRPPPLTGTRIGAHAVEFSKTAASLWRGFLRTTPSGPCPERAVDDSASVRGFVSPSAGAISTAAGDCSASDRSWSAHTVHLPESEARPPHDHSPKGSAPTSSCPAPRHLRGPREAAGSTALPAR